MRLLKLPEYLELSLQKLTETGEERFVSMSKILSWTWAEQCKAVKKELEESGDGDDSLHVAQRHERFLNEVCRDLASSAMPQLKIMVMAAQAGPFLKHYIICALSC